MTPNEARVLYALRKSPYGLCKSRAVLARKSGMSDYDLTKAIDSLVSHGRLVTWNNGRSQCTALPSSHINLRIVGGLEELDTNRIPDSPTRLLGATSDWLSRTTLGECPVCGGQNLAANEFCLRCDNWGLDLLNNKRGEKSRVRLKFLRCLACFLLTKAGFSHRQTADAMNIQHSDVTYYLDEMHAFSED